MDEREISLNALSISDLSLRREYVERICDENTELLDRVNFMIDSLQSVADSSSFPDSMTLDFSSCGGSWGSKTLDDAVGTNGMETRNAPDTELIKTDSFDESIFRILLKSEQHDSIGRLVNYEIKRVIGRGAFGIVLEGFDSKLRRTVAVKVLAPTLAQRPDDSQRFVSEAQAVAAIRHENVVQIYSIEEEPIPYLVMEYIPGKTLQALVDETGPLPLSQVLHIGQQIADGLDAAHQKGLVHRDIKPSNILLEDPKESRVKITDFGLARDIRTANSGQGGLIVGTPLYMSPEQAEGQVIDQRSDLFSLGSVLYFMITGRPPFEGASAMAILSQVSRETATPIQSIVPLIPDSLCAIVATLHAKKPENRFNTAKEVSNLLKKCLSEMKLQDFPTFTEVDTPLAEPRAGTNPQISITSRAIEGKKPQKLRKQRWIALTIIPFIGWVSYFFIPKAGGEKVQPVEGQVTNPNKNEGKVLPRTLSAKFSLTRLRMFLNQSAMSHGELDDLELTDEILTCDATTRSPNLWVNFFTVEGEEWTFTSGFRNLTPHKSGHVKLVFMPADVTEVCATIGNWDGRSAGLIELPASRNEEPPQIPLPLVDTGDWTKVKFVVNRDEFQFFVGDELISRSPRKNHKRGHFALCVSGWQCQFRDPQVLLEYTVPSIPDSETGSGVNE